MNNHYNNRIEMAEVMRQFAPAYLQQFGPRMLPSHRRALRDIIDCRTPRMGGHAWRCEQCDKPFFVYHGCRNRACPACHTRQTEQWLEKRQAELLPCPYFHVTVTIPKELHAVFRANQQVAYDLLLRAAAAAVLELAADPRHMGGLAGLLAVLHTWTAKMDYHPHVHLLVTGGGAELDAAGQLIWRQSRQGFFVHARLIARLVRGKLCAALARDHPALLEQIPAALWRRDWVADCRPWGQGEQAVLDYLARYVFRVALTNRRIVAMDDRSVTFRWKDRAAGRWRTCRVSGQEFLRRFLQHVLPQGFHKVRYYGLWNPGKRELAAKARAGLELAAALRGDGAGAPVAAASGTPEEPGAQTGTEAVAAGGVDESDTPRCPHCRSRKVLYLRELRRGGRGSLPDP